MSISSLLVATDTSQAESSNRSGENIVEPNNNQMDTSHNENPDASAANTAGPSNSRDDKSDTDSYITASTTEATVSEATKDRIMRLENNCDCCGLSPEEKRSDCPCGRKEGTDFKSHSIGPAVGTSADTTDNKICCSCGDPNVGYVCTHCNCRFCCIHCSTHQVTSEIHSDPEDPTDETDTHLLLEGRTMKRLEVRATEEEIRESFAKLDREFEAEHASNDNQESNNPEPQENKTDTGNKRGREDSEDEYEGKGKKRKN